jgi:hypothetical protein
VIWAEQVLSGGLAPIPKPEQAVVPLRRVAVLLVLDDKRGEFLDQWFQRFGDKELQGQPAVIRVMNDQPVLAQPAELDPKTRRSLSWFDGAWWFAASSPPTSAGMFHLGGSCSRGQISAVALGRNHHEERLTQRRGVRGGRTAMHLNLCGPCDSA